MLWNNDMAVAFGGTTGLASVCRHRFEHARLFGGSRVKRGESAVRIALKSPIVPAVLVARIARRVARHGQYMTAFVASIPLIVIIAAAWAAGEASGAVQGTRANRS